MLPRRTRRGEAVMLQHSSQKAAIAALAVLLTAGCGATVDESLQDALTRSTYRIVMSAPLAGGTRDVYHARGESFPDFPRVAENVCTGYAAVDAGAYDINVRDPSGSDQRVPELSTNFARAGRYLFVARVDDNGAMSLSQHFDARIDAGAGQVLLRFVNATTDGMPFDVSELVGGTAITGVTADTNSLAGGDDNDAAFELTVPADTPIPLLLTPGGRFTTAPLPSNARVTVVARDASAQPQLLVLPPVNPLNATEVATVASGGQLVVVDNASADSGFGAIIADARQGQSITLGSPSDASNGAPTGRLPTLDLTSTYIVLASISGESVVFAPYRDTSASGSLRVINAMRGLSAPDVVLEGAAITYSDLVVGAAASHALAHPASVTGVTVKDASGTTTYAPRLGADTRYMILVGDVATTKGITILNLASDGTWSSAFVLAR
jgi:hypothetical protein